jgi:hypothetical protein
VGFSDCKDWRRGESGIYKIQESLTLSIALVETQTNVSSPSTDYSWILTALLS